MERAKKGPSRHQLEEGHPESLVTRRTNAPVDATSSSSCAVVWDETVCLSDIKIWEPSAGHGVP